MIPRGSLKKKSPITSTTTTRTSSISLSQQQQKQQQQQQQQQQPRRVVVTIKEPSPQRQQHQNQNHSNSISPASDASSTNFQDDGDEQDNDDRNDNNNSVESYIRVLKSTIAEQRRHLDVARFAMEKELREKQNRTAEKLTLEEEIDMLKNQLRASQNETNQYRVMCENQKSEIVGLKNQLSQQLTTNQLLSRAADEERSNSANILNKYEKLKEEFDANELVFKELLRALREKETVTSMTSNNNSKNNISSTTTMNRNNNKSKQKEEEEGEEKEPEVWMSAWRQLQQRRYFEKNNNNSQHHHQSESIDEY